MGATAEVEHATADDSSNLDPPVGKKGKDALDPLVLEVLRCSTVSISATSPPLPPPPGIHCGVRASTTSRRCTAVDQGSHR